MPVSKEKELMKQKGRERSGEGLLVKGNSMSKGVAAQKRKSLKRSNEAIVEVGYTSTLRTKSWSTFVICTNLYKVQSTLGIWILFQE